MASHTTELQNRRAVLRETNPRKTIMNEPSSCISPVTGQVYEDRNLTAYYTTSPNQVIQAQASLGRMEARDGNIPLSDYKDFLDNVRLLTSKYEEDELLTLDSITDVTGLNAALDCVERQREKGLIGLIRKIDKGTSLVLYFHRLMGEEYHPVNRVGLITSKNRLN